ncbi:MAG: hypothetical protein LBM70_03820 [Victivallales bacterium]|jgi:hypothetical protein|nr:hypothetical protein [Victivallales bacterium]
MIEKWCQSLYVEKLFIVAGILLIGLFDVDANDQGLAKNRIAIIKSLGLEENHFGRENLKVSYADNLFKISSLSNREYGYYLLENSSTSRGIVHVSSPKVGETIMSIRHTVSKNQYDAFRELISQLSSSSMTPDLLAKTYRKIDADLGEICIVSAGFDDKEQTFSRVANICCWIRNGVVFIASPWHPNLQFLSLLRKIDKLIAGSTGDISTKTIGNIK